MTVTPPQNAPQKKALRKDVDQFTGGMEAIYAKINSEAAAVMHDDDRIVFLPAEDFEYKIPLEDFQKSDKYKAP